MARYKLALAVAVFTVAAYFAATGSWPWRRLDPEATPTLATVAEVVRVTHTELADTLHRGETLSELFERQRVAGIDLSSLTGALDPRRLRAGMVFNFRRPVEDSVPDRITVRTGPEQRVRFVRAATGWDMDVEPIAWTPEIVRVSGRIDASLYVALDEQVADSVLTGPERERLAWGLAEVYAWQVDFTRDIRTGDRFQVLLERLVSEEGEIRYGRVLAADLNVDGKQLTAFRFAEDGDASRFYDQEGNSLKRAFLRAPVEFRRISSNFSRARFHPVLGRTRKHEGTDYAASTGTAVVAAGEGTVIRAGRAGGYGNLVEIRHRNGITTRYAHLSRILTRRGARVSQGELIGRVGSTGLASGPHLHYEFRVNGVAKDSRRVELGNGAPVAKKDRAAFEAERARLEAQLYRSEMAPQPQLIAQLAN
ncbi:MAG TPA: peptidoglycan DD-metalloendopeptidase family protein [Gemmatimonadales bacterium]|nr:peptidoglycan DD-metalloendopeptidase family protein [Gemmatimonadales bacterium]